MPAIRGNFLLLAATLAAFTNGGAAEQAQRNAKVAIVTRVELVQIPTIVLDEKGVVVTNLKKSDFHIVEDGVEQDILYCDQERKSVSFAIIADVSESMSGKIGFLRDAVASVVRSESSIDRNRYQDEYSVIGVESKVTQLVPFTSDGEVLIHNLSSLLMPTKGSTALFDGIYEAVLTANQEASNERRAIIIVSDGGDNHSRHNRKQIEGLLEEADVPVFAIMAGRELETDVRVEVPLQIRNIPIPFPAPRRDFIGPAEFGGPKNLAKLTEMTGGGVFTAHDPEGLNRIVRTISDTVRYQYVLSYQSTMTGDVRRNNNWHPVRLELTSDNLKGHRVYYKRGYYHK
jgi:Ca-activated chloride channel family protein